jgi:hypothetical protein
MAVLLLLLTLSSGARGEGDVAGPEPLGRIPFELNRNRVVLPVGVEGSRELNLTFDTGMVVDGILLFHKEIQHELQAVDFEEVLVPGAGGGDPSRAIMADSVRLSAGGVEFPDQLLLISQSETTQRFKSDGVIGWTIFKAHVVEIDYDESLIRLYDPETYRPPESWERLDLTLQKKIPFLDAAVSIEGEEEIPFRVYVDLASGDAVELLVRDDAKFAVPDSLEQTYLGTGLSGDIHGGVGRIASLRLGSFVLRDVVTAFAPSEIRSKQENADGILGNNAIRRFLVVFDYMNGHLYLRPSRSFGEPFDESQPR